MSIKVRLDTKSVDQCQKDVIAVFNKVIANRTMMNEIGQTVVQDIAFQTRSGKSIPNQGEKFNPLSEAWIKERKQIIETHETFSQKRSNLTVTGQLINSMKHVILGPGKIAIDFIGTHKPYVQKYVTSFRRKTKAGKRITVQTGKTGTRKVGKPIPNQDLARYVAEGGRPFVGVREQVKQRINRIVLAYIRRASRVFEKLNK